MINSEPQSLNVFIACLHLVIAVGTMVVLKKAYKPLTRFTIPSKRIKEEKDRKAEEN